MPICSVCFVVDAPFTHLQVDEPIVAARWFFSNDLAWKSIHDIVVMNFRFERRCSFRWISIASKSIMRLSSNESHSWISEGVGSAEKKTN